MPKLQCAACKQTYSVPPSRLKIPGNGLYCSSACRKAITRAKLARELTAERLREVLDYDPYEGEFRWLVTIPGRVSVGDLAGHIDKKGRRQIAIDRHQYFASRLAWLYVFGTWPKGQIDHIDRDISNDRIANLRKATNGQNAANSKRRRNNTTGFKGVIRNSTKHGPKKYTAQIAIDGIQYYIGRLATPEEAHAAYVDAGKKAKGEFFHDGF